MLTLILHNYKFDDLNIQILHVHLDLITRGCHTDSPVSSDSVDSLCTTELSLCCIFMQCTAQLRTPPSTADNSPAPANKYPHAAAPVLCNIYRPLHHLYGRFKVATLKLSSTLCWNKRFGGKNPPTLLGYR